MAADVVFARTRAWLALDRSRLLVGLSLPIVLAALSFAMAVTLPLLGAPQIGSMRSNLSGAAIVYLTLGFMWLPGYAIGCAWFWWRTRAHDDHLFASLYKVPLVAAALVWFPALVFTPTTLGQKVRMYPAMAISALMMMFIWIGLVRLILHLWRRFA